ncbi:MAG: putative internalin [Myxococcales bacterium]|nr:putative internalin [Myxococcales bacterium]
MAGVHVFNSRSELGVADQPDGPSQRNSLLAGLRIGIYFAEVLGIEAEVGMIPTVARETEFGVTDLTYRAQLVAQARARNPDAVVLPIMFVGAGGFSVVNSKNENYVRDPMRNISEDTDAAYFVGAGVKIRAGDHWGLRADARVLAVPSSENTIPADPNNRKVTADFEALVSVYAVLGGDAPARRDVIEPPPDGDGDHDSIRGAQDQCPAEPEDPDGFSDDDGCPEPDNDADGLVDGEDTCAFDAEDRDGFQDGDGCPEHDNDSDGITDNTDRCPAEAEDKDGFQDDDGCPEPDNDADGITDLTDGCDAEPETINGYRDEDGCPDQMPGRVQDIASRPLAGIQFKVNSTELSSVSSKALDELVAVLVATPDLRIEIEVHTDDLPIRSKKFGTNLELSQARADAIRAYVVAKGVSDHRITAKGYGAAMPLENPTGLRGRALTAARAKNRRVELKPR